MKLYDTCEGLLKLMNERDFCKREERIGSSVFKSLPAVSPMQVTELLVLKCILSLCQSLCMFIMIHYALST